MKALLTALVALLLALPALGFELAVGDRLPSLILPTAQDHTPLGTNSLLGGKSLVHVFASW